MDQSNQKPAAYPKQKKHELLELMMVVSEGDIEHIAAPI